MEMIMRYLMKNPGAIFLITVILVVLSLTIKNIRLVLMNRSLANELNSANNTINMMSANIKRLRNVLNDIEKIANENPELYALIYNTN